MQQEQEKLTETEPLQNTKHYSMLCEPMNAIPFDKAQ